MQSPTCNLCTITRGVIARGDLWTMALNDNQTLLGRCYFKLNRHSTDATDLTNGEILALRDWFKRSKNALDKMFAPDHYNYVMLMNVEPHVHAHIIPRYKAEREFGGAVFRDLTFGGHYDIESDQRVEGADYDKLVLAIRAALPAETGRS